MYSARRVSDWMSQSLGGGSAVSCLFVHACVCLCVTCVAVSVQLNPNCGEKQRQSFVFSLELFVTHRERKSLCY